MKCEIINISFLKKDVAFPAVHLCDNEIPRFCSVLLSGRACLSLTDDENDYFNEDDDYLTADDDYFDEDEDYLTDMMIT